MKCLVTAGPTYEPLDRVRRLTNFSTGGLGTRLANCLADQGHEVTLLIGEQATWTGERRAAVVEVFSTTNDLADRLKRLASREASAVFHAAAVSDFAFGRIWEGPLDATLSELAAERGKVASRSGRLLAELLPTPKIIAALRDWYPQACLVGWKFEVEGDRAAALDRATRQIQECRTDACVANGPAYGAGFGIVRAEGTVRHFDEEGALFEGLAAVMGDRP